MAADLHLEYIKNYLINEIVEKLTGEILQSYDVDSSTGLDGFMSSLYNITLKTQVSTTGENKERLVIVKFMRGDDAFRVSSKSYLQFANEIYVYAEILPAYENILRESGVDDVDANDWVAPSYVAKFGYIEGLSSSPNFKESVLVLKHLKPDGYRLGPRLYLRRDQLLAMCKPLAQYHGTGYALRLLQPPVFERLKAGIVPLPFRTPSNPLDKETNMYHILYRVGFDRFFDFCDRKLETLTDEQKPEDVKLLKALTNLREKYFKEPTELLERLRTQVEDNELDKRFAIIQHGDFNRNNVLFHYKPPSTEAGIGNAESNDAEVDDVKMIDFQEMRYGSPALDLSFYMYMNTPPELRPEIWSDLLKTYHGHVIDILKKILTPKCTAEELTQILSDYSFENFKTHFERYALYGVMVCLHFMPWLLCPDAECAELSHLFETDMHGPAFYKLSIEAGGDVVNVALFELVRHACANGYMDHI